MPGTKYTFGLVTRQINKSVNKATKRVHSILKHLKMAEIKIKSKSFRLHLAKNLLCLRYSSQIGTTNSQSSGSLKECSIKWWKSMALPVIQPMLPNKRKLRTSLVISKTLQFTKFLTLTLKVSFLKVSRRTKRKCTSMKKSLKTFLRWKWVNLWTLSCGSSKTWKRKQTCSDVCFIWSQYYLLL